MQARIPSTTLRFLLLLLFLLLFVVFFYTFLHEAGHALTGLLFGQSLLEFNVSFWDFSAHVDMSGGLTPPQLAVQAAAGTGLPLLIWAIFIYLVSRKGSFVLEVLKLISSMVVLNTLLTWILIPVLYMSGSAPASDDVTHFLLYSQMPPSFLLFLAGMIYVCGWAYFLTKIDGLRNEFLLFQNADRETLLTGTRTSLLAMAVVLIFGIGTTILLNRSNASYASDELSPPPGFAVIAEIDLSRQAYSNENLAEFTLDEPAYVGVFVVVRNINTRYFDLRVLGSEGYQSVVLHGEGYRSERDGGLWEERLPPGTYQVVVSSEISPGTSSVFLRVP